MAGSDPKLYLCLLGVVLIAWRYLFNRRRTEATWEKIPGPPSASYWLGNMSRFSARDGTDFQRHVSLDYGPVSKIYGLFSEPIINFADPKALHTILIKEEHIFQESQAFLSMNMLVFGPGLLSTVGDMHRRQRKLLNPAFSTSHMRSMLPIFYRIVHKLRDAISTQVKEGPREVDILNWMGRTALELIGQGGLGYSFDPLTEDVQNQYGNALKDLFPSMQKLGIVWQLVPFISKLGPAHVRRAMLDMIPYKKAHKVKAIVDTMSQKSQGIFDVKATALRSGDEVLAQQVGEGKDIMSILMRANATTSDEDRLPDHELIAQMSTLVLAAVDTTSNALSRILQLLAEHQGVQEKLRKEILDAGASDSLTYDELDQLPFLDSVCRETLRVYPPVFQVFREAISDTVLQLSEPIVGTDGKLIHEIPITKGMKVVVGILGCNLSKSLWGEDAREWKPERWLSPLPSAVTKNTIPGVYANLMSFLGGKRGCIGFKFSEMEMKVVLSVLLSSFKFELTDKPIEWNVAGVRYPTVGKVSDVPQLPLRVELLKA
ncbi:uncharacterized protein FIBRA_09623 [Fibroporia radiculosa]|uniref:Cytochrome P450 n=1 Tax=Fibroporia radiculosa TaxID=599839 RepID=J4GWQ3_9APHY|nr:uncharacterized protein FIBRA_09623 [Fibroporia radiculosa]CCM06150.1 predicted protein [Fibroporia radiculosa]